MDKVVHFGMIFIIIAATLYSVSILTEKIQKKLKRWMLRTFALGFLSDIVGTSTMMAALVVTGKFGYHVPFGIAALLIMGVHFY